MRNQWGESTVENNILEMQRKNVKCWSLSTYIILGKDTRADQKIHALGHVQKIQNEPFKL